MIDSKPIIFLYDMPRHIVTSVKIAEIVKKAADYDLTEPVQFRPPRYSAQNGLISPLVSGLMKVDQKDFQKVALAVKYFDITDSTDTTKVWHCRALPFDKDLMGAQKNIMNVKQNVFLKCIPKTWNARTLEEKFSCFGPVKSAKVSLSPIIKR